MFLLSLAFKESWAVACPKIYCGLSEIVYSRRGISQKYQLSPKRKHVYLRPDYNSLQDLTYYLFKTEFLS
jgi:hypothetical protein